MTEDVRIAVMGAGGRMGRALVRSIAETAGCQLVAATERAGAETLGDDVGTLSGLPALGVALEPDPVEAIARAQSVIDFTAPAATLRHAELCAQAKAAHIIGTTGLSADDEAALDRAARHCPVVYAPNMSLGVNLLLALVEQVARALPETYDIEVLEMHHRRKVDAPSGTALGLGRVAASGRGVDLDEVAERVRDGVTGPRKSGSIGFATLRGGDVIGDHSVIFAGAGERIELSHKAQSREIYAAGALRAALWANQQMPGLYSMRDVLGMAA